MTALVPHAVRGVWAQKRFSERQRSAHERSLLEPFFRCELYSLTYRVAQPP